MDVTDAIYLAEKIGREKMSDKNNEQKPDVKEEKPGLGEEKKDEGYKFNKESDKPKIGEEEKPVEQPSRDEDEKQALKPEDGDKPENGSAEKCDDKGNDKKECK